MIPDSEDLGEPDGYIRFNNGRMGVWLPEGVDPDELDIQWVGP